MSLVVFVLFFFFFKQKTAYEMRISDWSSDVCSSDLKGIRMTVADWKRPSPETAPCRSKAAGLYMICTLSKHAAEGKGYADALMLDYRGLIAEATGANVFLVQDGKIHTPAPDCFLDGITRRTVIDLARRRGYEVIERQRSEEHTSEL